MNLRRIPYDTKRKLSYSSFRTNSVSQKKKIDHDLYMTVNDGRCIFMSSQKKKKTNSLILKILQDKTLQHIYSNQIA